MIDWRVATLVKVSTIGRRGQLVCLHGKPSFSTLFVWLVWHAAPSLAAPLPPEVSNPVSPPTSGGFHLMGWRVPQLVGMSTGRRGQPPLAQLPWLRLR